MTQKLWKFAYFVVKNNAASMTRHLNKYHSAACCVNCYERSVFIIIIRYFGSRIQ